MRILKQTFKTVVFPVMTLAAMAIPIEIGAEQHVEQSALQNTQKKQQILRHIIYQIQISLHRKI